MPRFPYLPCRKVTDKNRPDLRPTMHSNRCNRRDRTLNFIVCAQKNRKKKKRKKEKKKREKYIQGEQKREGLDEEENDYIVITAGTKSYAAKESCQITLKMTLYVYDIVFFTFYHVIRYQRYQFFQSLTSNKFLLILYV